LYEYIQLETGVLFQKVSQLSQRHTMVLGVRYLDMLHVASAVVMKATRFLTFDGRQQKLAETVDLQTTL
jgi:hypothetical protein